MVESARNMRGILEATLAYHTFSSSTEEKARMRSRFRFHVLGFSVAVPPRCGVRVSAVKIARVSLCRNQTEFKPIQGKSNQFKPNQSLLLSSAFPQIPAFPRVSPPFPT